MFGPWSDFFDVDRFFGKDGWGRTQSVPSVNVKENGDSFIVEVAASGMDKNDFKIDVEDDVLTISAEKKQEKKDETEKYTRREFSYNSFSRSFTLPENVNGDQIKASYENGMLVIKLPKKEVADVKKGRQISIA